MNSQTLIEIVRHGLLEHGFSCTKGCTRFGIFKHPSGKRIRLTHEFDDSVSIRWIKEASDEKGN